MRFKNLLFLLFTVVLFKSNHAVTRTAVSGDWATAGTWAPAGPVTCDDSLIIPAGVTVTITSQQDYEYCGAGLPLKIAVYGTLKFTSGNKLKLPCNSRIYVFDGGKIEPGAGGGNSNYIEICDENVWNAGSGTYSGPACLPPSLPSCGAVLPVELLYFNGHVNSESIDLSWATATENNSAHFDIERSYDAGEFGKVACVPSLAPDGNSHFKIDYSANDKDPLDGVSYYRLKQVDKDNTYTYSGLIAVEFIKEKNIRFLIYPNPNPGEFTADISGLENNHELRILLRNVKGETVYQSSFHIEETSAKINIVPEIKLQNGVYVCSIVLHEIEYKVKVIVSNS